MTASIRTPLASVLSHARAGCRAVAQPRGLVTLLVAGSIVATAAARTVAFQDDAGEHQRAGQDVRFVAVDITLDPAGEELAAYQLRIPEAPGITLVGVEGGEPASAFAKPPVYDPAALAGQSDTDNQGAPGGAADQPMIVLAAFSLDGSIDRPTRVARLHLQVTGRQAVELDPVVIAAGDPAGERLEAVKVSVRERAAE